MDGGGVEVGLLKEGTGERASRGKTKREDQGGLDEVWMVLCKFYAKRYAKQHLLGRGVWRH